MATNIKLEGGVGVGLSGAVGVDLGLENIQVKELPVIRTNSTADVGLSDIGVSVKELPIIRTDSTADVGLSDIGVSVKELPIIRTDSAVDLGLDDIQINNLPPVELEVGFRPFRLHLPVNYQFCLRILGIPLFKFSICGEGMAIGEDNTPRETEKCR